MAHALAPQKLYKQLAGQQVCFLSILDRLCNTASNFSFTEAACFVTHVTLDCATRLCGDNCVVPNEVIHAW